MHRPDPDLAVHCRVGGAVVADGQLGNLDALDVVPDVADAQDPVEKEAAAANPGGHVLERPHLEAVICRVHIETERVELELDKVPIGRVALRPHHLLHERGHRVPLLGGR